MYKYRKTIFKITVSLLTLALIVWVAIAFHLTNRQEYDIPFRIGVCVILALMLWRFWVRFEDFAEFIGAVLHNRRLLFQLAKNDFRSKYAGSYLGIIWAYINPIVTILVYWFVFEKGLRSSSVQEVPFVLWLSAGIIPWFFFADSVNSGTNALIEYQYLVKKVVFRIDILPVVKILSAFFVHAAFVVILLVLYCAFGVFPTIYSLQLIYYSFALCVLVVGIAYITSAIVGFFRDLTPLIGILLSIGVWMTPIMWNIDTMDIAAGWKLVLKANPMYYIVAGYRDAMIHHVWFWEHPGLTLYYWIVTFFILGFGMVIFKKLKPHFADVL